MPKKKEPVAAAFDNAPADVKIVSLIRELLLSHWDRIHDAKKESDDGTLTIGLSVHLKKDKLGKDVAETRISYGVKTKETATCELDDPHQGKLMYELKRSAKKLADAGVTIHVP